MNEHHEQSRLCDDGCPHPPAPAESAKSRKRTISRKTTEAQKELEYEATRMSACLCSAIDAALQAENYASRKGFPDFHFNSEDIRSIGLSLYIRRRDEAKSGTNNSAKARP